jgi:hypothetical protein
MEIIRVEVIEPKGRKRKFKPLWLAWLGETMPPVEQLWLKYLRRFAIEMCQPQYPHRYLHLYTAA